MKVLIMTEKLLNLICMLQSAKVLFLSEKLLLIDECPFNAEFYNERSKVSFDWISRLKNYYFSLDEDYIELLGLKKNMDCFNALECFDVTDEMVSASPKDLAIFIFSY